MKSFTGKIGILALIVLLTAFHEKDERKEVKRLYPARVYPDRIVQSITADPTTQISISWRVSDTIPNGHIEYLPLHVNSNFDEKVREENAELIPVTFEGITDHYFQAKLENLKPNTEYQVRVGHKDYMSEWFHVSTAEESPKPFHFLHFAGVQHDIKAFGPRIYRAAYKNFPEARFHIHSGDIVQARGGDNDWGELTYSGSWMLGEKPMVPAAGNSDHWETKTKSVYNRTLYPQWNGIFNLPANHPEKLKNLAYYFDYQGVRVITLYSGLEAAKEDRPTLIDKKTQMTEGLFFKQVEWLKKVLEENTQQWVVVHLHHPVVCGRKERNYDMHEKYIKPVLEEYKADLVLQGHEHLYARGRSKNSNRPVYVTSKAGPRSKEVDHSREWIEKSVEKMQLYQVIYVSPGKLKIQAFNLKNDLVDEVILKKD